MPREQLQLEGGELVPMGSGQVVSSPTPPRSEPVGSPSSEPTFSPRPAENIGISPQLLDSNSPRLPVRPPLVLRPAGRVNLITQDGSQYDDDNLRMFQRAGIIIRDKDGNPTPDDADIDEVRLETTDENGNTISEPILDLTNPNIKQLIAVYPTYQDKVLNQNRYLFTGKKFYEKLEKDFNDGNVYAINAAFDERFTIKIVLEDILEVLTKNQLAERGRDIEMYRNLAFLDTGEIDYNLLIAYVDWCISKPNYLEYADNNVIPVEYIADYSIKGRPSKDSELEGQAEPNPPYDPSTQSTPPNPSAPTGVYLGPNSGPQINTLSAAESTAIVTPINYTGQYPPFGVPGNPGEFRQAPDGRMFMWVVFNGFGSWRPYEIGTGGGAAPTSGGAGGIGAGGAGDTGAAGLGGDAGLGGGNTGFGGSSGGIDPSGAPGGGRPGVIP